MQAWIIGFRPDGAGGPASRGGAEIVPPNPAGAEVGREPPRTLAAGPSKRAQRSRSEPGEQPTAVKTPRKRTRQRAAAKVETGRRRVDAPEPNEPMRAASRPIRVIDESSRSSDEIRSQSADPNARRVGRNGATPAAPRVRPPSLNPDQQREAELEDSILSAIADAVDVLADNGLEEDEAKEPEVRGFATHSWRVAPNRRRMWTKRKMRMSTPMRSATKFSASSRPMARIASRAYAAGCPARKVAMSSAATSRAMKASPIARRRMKLRRPRVTFLS